MHTANQIKTNQGAALWQAAIPEVAVGTLALFVGIAVGYYVVISSALAGSLSYPMASIICCYLCFASFTVMHDAGHGAVFRMGSRLKPLESVIGWIASLPLLVAPYRVFQKIHDRHHAFTNDPQRDPDHFSFGDKWYQIIPNFLFIPFQYHWMSVTSLRHLKQFRDTYPSTIAYLVLVMGTLGLLTNAGYGQEVLLFAVVPTIVAVFLLVAFFDYVPHHPHKSLGRYQNTRIYPGKLLNAVLLGQNYHLIHHMYPRIPWYKYEQVYHRILPELEAHDAPIEDVFGGKRPGLMHSPNANKLQDGGKSVHHLLKVSHIERLTDDAVAVSFALPESASLEYQAGQYITVSKWLGGAQQTRCYSLCSSPSKREIKIGVRSVPGGVFSEYMNHKLRVGDELIVQGPFGDFVYPPSTQLGNRFSNQTSNQASTSSDVAHVVLIAGGSGITPLLSILEKALETDSNSASNTSVHLLYAARSTESIMFLNHLKDLQSKHREHLKIDYIVQNKESHEPGIPGRLDPTLLKQLLHADSNNTAYYVCGPQGLKDMTVNTLQQMGIPDSRYFVEEFVAPLTAPEGALHTVSVALADGTSHTLSVAANQTVLEVASSNQIQLPHACGSGTCGSCKLKVEEGVVHEIPDSVPGITVEERDAGFTLACQCRPESDLRLSEKTL
jgi:ferredoxin-NADP reductase/fatty acid desaturase